jgi:hypothetical protein
MTRMGKETLGRRLGALAYWLAFSAVVAVLWVVLPVQAAATKGASHAALTSHPSLLNNHNND